MDHNTETTHLRAALAELQKELGLARESLSNLQKEHNDFSRRVIDFVGDLQDGGAWMFSDRLLDILVEEGKATYSQGMKGKQQ